MSTPTRSRQRRPIASGSASPAETQRRSRSEPAPGPISGWASNVAYSVGTPQKIVGRARRMTARTDSAVGRCGISTVAAPTDIGNVMLLPSP